MSMPASMTMTSPRRMSVVVDKILEILPDALFDERQGEIVILTGTELVGDYLVPIKGDNSD